VNIVVVPWGITAARTRPGVSIPDSMCMWPSQRPGSGSGPRRPPPRSLADAVARVGADIGEAARRRRRPASRAAPRGFGRSRGCRRGSRGRRGRGRGHGDEAGGASAQVFRLRMSHLAQGAGAAQAPGGRVACGDSVHGALLSLIRLPRWGQDAGQSVKAFLTPRAHPRGATQRR
jgi:hypothetical protein